MQRRTISSEQRERAFRAIQSGGNATIPPSLEGNFDDFSPLSLSASERDILRELHLLSLQNGYEYGRIQYTNCVSEIFTSNKPGAIEIPVKIDEKNIRVYHSHTNDTPQSHTDLAWLTDERMAQINVVTNNGDVFRVEVGDGWIPTREEFNETYLAIASEVDTDIQNIAGFSDMNYEERTYMAIREQAYRLSRHFGWTMSGGKLNG